MTKQKWRDIGAFLPHPLFLATEPKVKRIRNIWVALIGDGVIEKVLTNIVIIIRTAYCFYVLTNPP